MNYIDLFSGIGGFALGAYWAGMRFENHYFSEIEPYCVELYQKRFPDAIPLGDIREVDCGRLMADAESNQRGVRNGNSTENAGWIITGGFPCTDISIAGKGAGIRGQRSGLWFEMWRIIRDLRPRFAIMENVGAITFRGLTDVLGSLTEIGYDAEWQDIRAEDVGAPHRRERIWIVAYPEGERYSQRENIERQGATGRQERPSMGSESGGHSEMAYSSSSGRIEDESDIRGRGSDVDGSSEETPNTDGQHDDDSGHGTGEICRERSTQAEICGSVSDSGRQRRIQQAQETRQQEHGRPGNCAAPTGKHRAALSGLGGCTHDVSKWLDGSWEDGIPRLAQEVPNRVARLKGDGNAIVPTIAELLWRQIKDVCH